MDTLSMSNTMSKGSVYESDSIYKAYLDDAESRLADGVRPKAISNEEIHKGDEILQIYRVEDDAIHGGMGSVWRVRHMGWNADLAMKRPQPRFFSEGSDRRKAEFVAECEHWINLGLHPNIVSCYYVREIGGVPTIFSEWMDGGSLKEAIRCGFRRACRDAGCGSGPCCSVVVFLFCDGHAFKLISDLCTHRPGDLHLLRSQVMQIRD